MKEDIADTLPLLLSNIMGLSCYSLIIWILKSPVVMEASVQQFYLCLQLNTWSLAPPSKLSQGHQRCSWKQSVSATRLAESDQVVPGWGVAHEWWPHLWVYKWTLPGTLHFLACFLIVFRVSAMWAYFPFSPFVCTVLLLGVWFFWLLCLPVQMLVVTSLLCPNFWLLAISALVLSSDLVFHIPKP